jgi:hypothetical protein
MKAELLLVFHNVKHVLSYNSFNCHSKLVHTIFEDGNIAKKFSCGCTKASTITLNVLGPFAHQRSVDGMKKSGYFSVSFDVSNMRNIKTYPCKVQYFSTENGVCQKILDFYEDLTKHHLIFLIV